MHYNTIFFEFHLNHESNDTFPFLQLSSLYVGRGSTNKVVEWFNLLALETRGYV